MNQTFQTRDATTQARIERAEARVANAEARTQLAETRIEHAKSRAESAETRTDMAETRAEFAKTRTEKAEIRTEHAETRAEKAESALEGMIQNEIRPCAQESAPTETSSEQRALAGLTGRQREVLELMARGDNTKQIAHLLSVSPKTVEYHRSKLMAALNVHDITGLVRLALRAGLISPEG